MAAGGDNLLFQLFGEFFSKGSNVCSRPCDDSSKQARQIKSATEKEAAHVIIIQSLNRCHFLQTSLLRCEVRGQAQAAAACLCLHCLLLI